MEPTWGLVSTEGVGRYSITCDTVGFFSNTVDDLDLLARVFRLNLDTKPLLKDFEIRGAKIALIKTHVWDQAGPGTQAAWDKSRLLLREAGAVLEDAELPEEFARCHRWREIVVAGEARSAFLSSKHLGTMMRTQVES